MAKRVESWKVTDEFWQRVEPLVPQRVRPPGKQYLRKPGMGGTTTRRARTSKASCTC